MLQDEYQAQVEKLTGMVDAGVNTADFLQVSGDHIVWLSRIIWVVFYNAINASNKVGFYISWILY